MSHKKSNVVPQAVMSLLLSRQVMTLSIPVLLLSCAPSRQEQAESLYAEAVEAFSNKKMGEAKVLLDSVKNYYSDIPTACREARDLGRLVVRYEGERTLAFLDSSLAACEQRLQEQMSSMAVDDANAPMPVYVAKVQQTWRAYGRCYLKAKTDANGHFSITSNYVGEKPIHHDHFEIKCGEQFVSMRQVDDGAFRNTFSNEEYVWETLRYEGHEAADVAKFISLYEGQRIVVEYLGPKAHYIASMTEADKKAICQVWELSRSLRESRKIRSLIRSVRLEMTHTAH